MKRKHILLALALVLLLALSLMSGLFVSVALADSWTQMNVDGFGNSNNKASTPNRKRCATLQTILCILQ